MFSIFRTVIMCKIDWQEPHSSKGTNGPQEFWGKLSDLFFRLLFNRCLCILLFLWESEGLWEYSSYPQLLLGSYTGKCFPISTCINLFTIFLFFSLFLFFFLEKNLFLFDYNFCCCGLFLTRLWWLAPTSLHMDSSVSTVCVWTHCFSVSVSSTTSIGLTFSIKVTKQEDFIEKTKVFILESHVACLLLNVTDSPLNHDNRNRYLTHLPFVCKFQHAQYTKKLIIIPVKMNRRKIAETCISVYLKKQKKQTAAYSFYSDNHFTLSQVGFQCLKLVLCIFKCQNGSLCVFLVKKKVLK